jgi:hypothetical protein
VRADSRAAPERVANAVNLRGEVSGALPTPFQTLTSLDGGGARPASRAWLSPEPYL